jgi:hypothetical protein
MIDLRREVEQAVDQHTHPIDRLQSAVRTHVRFHATRTKEVFVGNSELRSLSSRNRAKIIRLRDEYEALFRDIVQQGCEAGAFHVDDVKVATFAVLAMCTGPSAWFSPRGRLSVNQLAELYTGLALRLLNAPSSDATARNGSTQRVAL